MAEAKKIRMQCPECRVTVRGNESLLTKAVTCPKCKNEIRFIRPIGAAQKSTGDTGDYAPVQSTNEATQLRCPKCAAELGEYSSSMGSEIACPDCKATLRVSKFGGVSVQPTATKERDDQAIEKKIRLQCPECRVTVRGNESLLAKKVTCPKCKNEIRFIRPIGAAQKSTGDTGDYAPVQSAQQMSEEIAITHKPQRKQPILSHEWQRIILILGGIAILLLGGFLFLREHIITANRQAWEKKNRSKILELCQAVQGNATADTHQKSVQHYKKLQRIVGDRTLLSKDLIGSITKADRSYKRSLEYAVAERMRVKEEIAQTAQRKKEKEARFDRELSEYLEKNKITKSEAQEALEDYLKAWCFGRGENYTKATVINWARISLKNPDSFKILLVDGGDPIRITTEIGFTRANGNRTQKGIGWKVSKSNGKIIIKSYDQ